MYAYTFIYMHIYAYGIGHPFTKYLGGILWTAYSTCLTAYIAPYSAICSLRSLRLLGKFGE